MFQLDMKVIIVILKYLIYFNGIYPVVNGSVEENAKFSVKHNIRLVIQKYRLHISD